jgi:glycosyltransferase involved in cell wall biosynthesis
MTNTGEEVARAGAATEMLRHGPRVSVIVPHLNTPELLVRCLQSVAAQWLDHGWFEIIVVDNGSRVSLDILKAAWPGVRFVLEREPGPGPARNLGVAHARAPVLAFVDADIRVGRGWLMQGVSAVESAPDTPFGGDVRIDFQDAANVSGVEAFEAVFSFRQKLYINRHGYSGSGNLMVSRKLFDKVGPFGPINTAEDAAWGRKAKAMGHRARYLPQMVVFHPARSGIAEMCQRWERINAHNFHAHQAAGKSTLLWKMRAWAVLLSPLAHAPLMLVSPRIPGIAARFRGMAFLFQTRWYRFMDMRRIARAGHAGAAMQWNRS